jgi:protein involved in polysaccharide export with SLBB domain
MIKRSFLLLGALIVLSAGAHAQLTAPSSSSSMTAVPTLTTTLPDKSAPSISPDAIIFDGFVSPNEYRLGPGDVLQYRSWTSNEAQQLMVSVDGVLSVPRYGPFSAVGKTLAQIQQEVLTRVSKEFKNAQTGGNGLFSLTISQPRRIMVTVQGQVETPGIYVYTGATRAALAIAIANKPVVRAPLLNDQTYEAEQEKRKREADRLKPYIGDAQDKTASLRKIVVAHSDGTTDKVDLLRFNSTHDPRFCPLLREGDVVYVPYKKTLEGQVGVYGAVNSPGDFEFVEGDSLWTLVRSCFGPTDNADLSKVELVRMNPEGTISETRVVDCNAIKINPSTDLPLQAGDRIFVRSINPDERELSRVIVKGEVRYPGVYPIGRTGTKLSDVIKLAGGFTSNAFLAGGTVTRKKIDIDNKDITAEDEAKLVGRLANLTVEDTANFHFLTKVRNPYVAVDMVDLFQKGNTGADIILRDGDMISIPVTPNSVYVWGFVGNTGYIPFTSGMSADEYINRAGGYAEGSVKEGTRVIKARTRQWVLPNQTSLEPGDEIYVPPQRLYPSGYDLQKTATIVGIVGAIVGTIATLVTLVVVLKK